MIIECESCNKKFELEESLIPDSGRLLKCSNCENTWFFNRKKNPQLFYRNTKMTTYLLIKMIQF